MNRYGLYIINCLVIMMIVTGCSGSKAENKANLDDEIFEKGTLLVQYSYMDYQGADEIDGYQELKEWYNQYMANDNYTSTDEELFFVIMKNIQTQQVLYAMEMVTATYTGDTYDVEMRGEEIDELYREIEGRFGMPYIVE